MKTSIGIMILGLSLMTGVAQGAPIISVYEDALSLSAYTELSTLGGGSLVQSDGYDGELLPVDRSASVSGWVLEAPCSGGEASCLDQRDHSARAEASTSSNSINLFAYSLFYPATGSLPPETLPVWDGVTEAIQSSVAELVWVFSSDTDLAVDFYFVKNSGDGYTSALLTDLTSSSVLLDFSGTTGFDHFEDIALVSGHQYVLLAAVADFSDDDDTEAYMDLVFSEDVRFVPVPEPSGLALLILGLIGLLGGRRLRRV